MKKAFKGFPVLLALVMVLMLSACSGEQVLTDSEQYAKETVESFIDFIHLQDEDLESVKANYATDPVIYYSAQNYADTVEKFGAFQSYETTDVTTAKDGSVSVRGRAVFGETETEFLMSILPVEVETNLETGKVSYGVSMDGITQITFDTVKTLGDKMRNAGLNTLMGMGVVFLVLILISLLISCFKYINRFEAKKNEAKKAAQPEVSKPAETETAEETVDETDDLELVAVIAAAIASYEGTSPDGIVVRSIRRVKRG